ncbi:MAG: hypothetical protein KF761_04200 [Salinibacterium sp.]|nr:hypothetical protein [Salinibacterium sp.]
MSLNRDDLIRGLREVVALLRERGEPAGIRIVGGAALSLRYFERRTTEDVDAKVHPVDAALAAAADIGAANGWPEDWLNTKADHFIPIANDVGWESLYVDGDVSIWVASAPALLAMKLRASRAGRDDDDIANLLAICSVDNAVAAADLYESFYLGEVLPDKAVRMLGAIFTKGLPEVPDKPPRPDFG